MDCARDTLPTTFRTYCAANRDYGIEALLAIREDLAWDSNYNTTIPRMTNLTEPGIVFQEFWYEETTFDETRDINTRWPSPFPTSSPITLTPTSSPTSAPTPSPTSAPTQ